MAEFDIESGGKKYHVSADNEQAAREAVGSREFGEATVGAAGMLIKLLLLIPSLIAMLVGFIVGGLLKLGIVGRVMLTALFALSVFILFIIPLLPFLEKESMVGLVLILALLAFVGVSAVWFFKKHYPVLKELSVVNLASYTTVCGTITFWGFVGLNVIAQLTGFSGNGISASIITLAPFVAAWIAWLVMVGEKLRLMLTAAGIAIAFCIVSGIGYGIKHSQRDAEFAKKVEANPALAIFQHDTPYEAIITADTKGMIASSSGPEYVDIPAGSTITVRGYTVVGSDRYMADVTFNGKKMSIEQLEAIKPLE